MKSKLLSPVTALLLSAALTGCGGGGGGSDSTTSTGTTAGQTATANQLPSTSTSSNSTSNSSSSGSSSSSSTATPSSYALTTSVTGSGSVSSAPTGVSCTTSSCSNSFTSGTALTLTATPASGYTFTGWGGVCSGTASTCSVTVSAASTVVATFAQAVQATQTLTVSVSGSGSVVSSGVISCATVGCTASVNQGTVVTLTATPASGYTFSGWSGACTGTSTCAVTLSAAKSVTATFAAAVASGDCTITRGTVGASPVISSTHPRILVNNASTLACLQQMVTSGKASATRFKAMVDDEVAQTNSTTYTWNNPKNYGFQYWFSALMYRVNGGTQYADFSIKRVDAMVASEEALIAAGQAASVSGDSYLDVGGMVGDVALVYDWCYDRLTATQRTRWITYMNQAVTNVWNPSTAKWGTKTFAWSGWSVDNPSNNYYYSFLRATMLTGLATSGENSSASTWITQFRTNKIANELVPTFNSDLVGGGSREGTGYGTAMKGLFQLYDWWERSTGERIATLTPHTLSSMAWLAHNMVPTLDYLAATGDQSRDSTVAFFDYHREYLLSLISLFPQERMSSVAKILLDNSSVPQVGYGFEYFVDYLYQPPALVSAAVTDLSTTYWGSGTGQLLMRSAWGDKTAAFSEFSCGAYTESHAHHDQGAFQIYRGSWLAPTGNIYTNSGIQQGEEFNNLVRVLDQSGNVIQQVYDSPRCSLNALADNTTYTYAMADVTPVYNHNAAISKIEREYLFIKPSTFVVFDRVVSASGTKRVWTLNLSDTPTISGDHLSVATKKAVISYNSTGETFTRTATGSQMDVYRVAPTGLSYVSNAFNYGNSGDTTNYGEAPVRIDVADTAGTQSNFLHVISTTATGASGAISNVVRSDATGQTGVQFTLADGRVVTARFNNATSAAGAGNGGTLNIVSSAGASLVTGNLPTTVTAPPLFRN